MLCEQMLYKFSDFDPITHFVVAPEGQNRFYSNGFGGEVVASWMTKRDRLNEIEDFSAYLSSLYTNYIDQLPSSCQKIVLGFSQGGTTMFRWVHAKKLEVDTMIAYSCWIPEDIDLKNLSSDMKNTKTLYTYGMQDEYFNEKIMKEVESIVEDNELKIKFIPYDGEHRIDKQNLMNIFKKYIRTSKVEV